MAPTTQHDPSTKPLAQHATRCQLLGIDQTGAEHVYDPERERVVVLDATGIQYQRDLPKAEKAEWMQFINYGRGWAKEQWVGWRLGKVLFGK